MDPFVAFGPPASQGCHTACHKPGERERKERERGEERKRGRGKRESTKLKILLYSVIVIANFSTILNCYYGQTVGFLFKIQNVDQILK